MFCLCKRQGGDIVERTANVFKEIGSGFRDILKSDKYRDYSGWILLDIRYDETGRIARKSVRLYQENETFRKELLAMSDRLPKPGKLTLDGNRAPYERFYVLLVEANEVVIPEEVLYKRRQVVHFKSN